MQFSLFFFTGKWPDVPGDHYQLFRETVQFADQNGFAAAWTPERHFNKFGGLYPSPSVAGAAVAAMTNSIGIRAGSVVLPIQNPVRVAEEWSVVDNLSQGRAGVSFASGWNVNDFVLSPETYPKRHDAMYERIETVRRLWRGESVLLKNGVGNEVEVSIYPTPYQREIPVWITAQSSNSCIKAGQIGFNLLTNMNYHNFDELGEKISLYRKALSEHQPGVKGHVTLMVHTFVSDAESIERKGKPAYADYLRTNLDLQSERVKGMGLTVDSTEEDIRFVISRAVDRMINKVGLIGTPQDCLGQARRFEALGVDEIACLIDFGVDFESTMLSLEHVSQLAKTVQQ